jgi:hypothetical protein
MPNLLNFEDKPPKEPEYQDMEVYASYEESEGVSMEEFAGEISLRTGVGNYPEYLEIDGVEYKPFL